MKNTNKIFTTFLITLVAMHGAYAAGGGKGSAVLAAIGQKIEDKVHENTDKKINKANEKKDVSATTTFMNNRLKIDKAFTKRYNELLPKGCGAGPVPACEDGGGQKLTAESTNKTNKKSLEHYEQQMMRATSVQALGKIYACAIKDYEECHYIGGAGSTAKTINGAAKTVDKLSMGKTNISDAMGGDVRNIIMSDKGTQLNTDGSCETNVVNSASSTSNDYLNRLSKCEKIEQVTLSGYTDEDIRKLEDEYKAKKENEQSLANRTLTAGAIATTGIGGMELAMGLSQQKADKDAAQSMAAYIATMRCTYGDGKQAKAGPEEIELPGGNNQQLMNLRAEYFALANDLKERKTALNMKPGIESEEILDKAATGLYDDEMVGITSGAYASLYRAQMLGSEEDQKKIDEEQKASKNRVIAGAVVGGVGVVGSMVGNSLVNGKLGELIKKDKNCKSIEKLYKTTTDSLEKLKSCLKDGGASNTDELSFDYFQADWLSLSGIKCKDLKLDSKDAKSLFKDSNSLEDVNQIVAQLKTSFGEDNTKTMLGAKSTADEDLQAALKTKIEKRASEYKDALDKDEKSGCNSSFLDGIKTGITDTQEAD